MRLRTHALVLAGLLVASPAVALTVLTGSVKAPDGVEIGRASCRERVYGTV